MTQKKRGLTPAPEGLLVSREFNSPGNAAALTALHNLTPAGQPSGLSFDGLAAGLNPLQFDRRSRGVADNPGFPRDNADKQSDDDRSNRRPRSGPADQTKDPPGTIFGCCAPSDRQWFLQDMR